MKLNAQHLTALMKDSSKDIKNIMRLISSYYGKEFSHATLIGDELTFHYSSKVRFGRNFLNVFKSINAHDSISFDKGLASVNFRVDGKRLNSEILT